MWRLYVKCSLIQTFFWVAHVATLYFVWDGTKFHSFPYSDCESVRVNMSCDENMSTKFKQRIVIAFFLVSKSTVPILLLHHNARPYTFHATLAALQRLKFKVLFYPFYRIWRRAIFISFKIWKGIFSEKRKREENLFHLRWWSEARCHIMDQTKKSWILHWHA